MLLGSVSCSCTASWFNNGHYEKLHYIKTDSQYNHTMPLKDWARTFPLSLGKDPDTKRDFIFKHHRYSESHQWTKTLVLLYNEHSVLNSPSLSSWDYTVWRTKGDSASFELIIIASITLISFNGHGAITELLKHISWNHHSISENLQHKTTFSKHVQRTSDSSGKIKQLPQNHFIRAQNQTMLSDHTKL